MSAESNARARPPRGRSAVLGALLLAVLVAAIAVVPRGAAQPASDDPAAPFTQEERAQLLAGELVRRPRSQREEGGVYIGGTSWQRVRAPRAQVWRVITDVSRYRRLLPALQSAEIVEDGETERLLLLRHAYLFVRVSYYARVSMERSRYTLRFRLDHDRPSDVRDGRGFIRLDRYGRGETILTWGVMADAGSGIMSGVFAGALHDWLLRVPYCVRGAVEPGQPGC